MASASQWLLAAVLALLRAAHLPAGELQTEVPIKLQDGYLIVVESSISGGCKLNLLIDTGAEYSVVNRETARRLGFTFIPQVVQLQSFGGKTAAGRAVVPGLKLGPATTSFPCLTADIPFSGVDAIIGLDVLRRRDFTIDYRARKMIFGTSEPMEERLAFEREAHLLIVLMRLRGRILRMSVDTGVDGICLYEDIRRSRTAAPKSTTQLTVVHLGGDTPGRQVPLDHVLLGSSEWMGLKAALLHSAQMPDRDGTLGVAALGLARIHFDFAHCIISWKR